MRNLARALGLALVFGACNTFADDIEIYFGTGEAGAPYVHFMIDPRPSAGSALCTVDGGTGGGGKKCSEMMTPEAFTELLTFPSSVAYAPGDSIPLMAGFKAVVAAVLRNPAFDGIRFAIISANTDKTGNTDGGGVILEGYKLLGDNRDQLIGTLKSIPTEYNVVMSMQPKEMTFEWWRYLTGGKVELTKETTGNYDMTVPVPNYDASIIDPNDRYVSPFTSADECPKLYSVLVSMNSDNADTDLDTEIVTEMGPLNPTAMTSIGKYKEVRKGDYGPLLRLIHDPDTDLLPALTANINIEKSWVIGDGKSGSQVQFWLDASIGTQDELLLTDPVALQEALTNTLKEIISVSSSFVSASVPVNVFNQTESLDNIYVALFEARNSINWPGNIKKLKLVDDPTDNLDRFVSIEDQNGLTAFETQGSDRGRIAFRALTYWTKKDALPLAKDAYDPNVTPDFADGRVVDRGGAGQNIPGVIEKPGYTDVIGTANGTGTRTVFLESIGSANNLVAFDAGDALADDPNVHALLGVSSKAEALESIKWGRGLDVDDSDEDGSTTDVRFWVLGDAIHSRPFALNYGDTDGNGPYDPNKPDIKLLFGTGGGTFHVVENTDSTNKDSGKELFAYYPREMLAQIERRRTSVELTAGTNMRYGIDGAPVVLTNDANGDQNLIKTDGDEAYVYFGMRRGGYSYHALDIIDPKVPKLVWKIEQTRTDSTSDNFEELGLTFSTPVVTKVSYDGTEVDALVFAGGYWGGWDPNDPTATEQFGKDKASGGDTFGNAIYVVNARTGELIWKVKQGGTVGGGIKTGAGGYAYYDHPAMTDSIPSDVSVIEDNFGFMYRLYVGDTGGSVWRVDTPSGGCESGDSTCTDWRKDRWFATRLADLAPSGEDVRFFHAPDIVQVKRAVDNVAFDGVIIQSGNRADPLDKRFDASTIDNHLHYIRDYNVAVAPNYADVAEGVAANGTGTEVPTYVLSDLANRSTCVGSETGSASSTSTCQVLNNNGWRIKYAEGEKGLSTPLVDFGRVFATTYSPSGEELCGSPSEGNGNLFLVNLTDGSPGFGSNRSYKLGPGIPSQPVVIGDAIWLPGGGILEDLDDDGKADNFLIQSKTQKLIPIYWREVGIDDL